MFTGIQIVLLTYNKEILSRNATAQVDNHRHPVLHIFHGTAR